MTQKLKCSELLLYLAAAILLSIILLGIFPKTAGATNFEEFFYPDTGLINGSTSAYEIPQDIIVDDYGRAWFATMVINTANYTRHIGVIDPCDGSIELKFSFPSTNSLNSRDTLFHKDSTGRYWLAKYKDKIAEVEFTENKDFNVLQEFSIPKAYTYSTPNNFYIAYDDTFWYFDSRSSRVSGSNDFLYHIDNTGSLINVYNSGAVTPGGLAVDKVGNAWYSAMETDEIIKLDVTTGSITRYPSNVGRPVVALVDNQENVWFASLDDRTINKIDSSGNLTPFSSVQTGNQQKVVYDGRYIYSPMGNEIYIIDTTNDTYELYATIPSTHLIAAYPTSGLFNDIWYSSSRNPKLPDYVSPQTGVIGRMFTGNDITDCEDPTITAVKPVGSEILATNGKPTFTFNLSDDSNIKKIVLKNSSNIIATITEPDDDFSYQWDMSSLGTGDYTVEATVYDTLNNTATASTGIIRLDRTAPTISITSPSIGAVVSNTVAVNATATDTNGMSNVQFRINGVNTVKDSSNPYGFNWNTLDYPDGSYTITAVATDNAGNTSTASRTVTIKNAVEPEEETTLCHFPGTQGQFTLTVANSALQGHLDHGDYIGLCTTPDEEEITTEINLEGKTVKTVQAGTDLSDVNLDVEENEILVVNGLLGEVVVKPGASIKGQGKVKNLYVQKGAFLEPGESPGCLSAENITLEGTYRFEATGLIACAGYDQAKIKGAVNVSGDLEIELSESFSADTGTELILIDNDESDSINGTFNALPEGAEIKQGIYTFIISYKGGDGNDAALTVKDVSTEENKNINQSAEEELDEDNGSAIYIGLSILVILVISGIIYFKDNNKN